MKKKEETKNNTPENVPGGCEEAQIRDLLQYRNQYRRARKLLIDDGLFTAGQMSCMTDDDVDDALQKNFLPVGCSADGETVRIIRRKDLPELKRILIELTR